MPLVARKHTPSWARTFARRKSESAYPNLWDGLMGAWFPSLGPTGLTLRDISGRGNHGTLENMDPATAWVRGDPRVGGYALEFDGSSGNVVRVPYQAGLASAFETKFSVFVMAKWNEFVGSDVLFEKPFTSHTPPYYQVRLFAAGSNINALTYQGAVFSTYLNTATSIALDTWYSILMTVDIAAPLLRLYLNGQLRGTDTTSSGSYLNHATGVGFGRRYNNTNDPFGGLIQAGGVWNRVLLSDEAQLLHDKPFAPVTPRIRVFPAAVAPPADAIMNQMQASNLGADLYNGTLIA